MTRYIVELEPGVYLELFGGHFLKRVAVIEKAQRFTRAQDAKGALTRIRRVRPYPNSKIVEV